MIKALAERTDGNLSNVDVDIVELSDHWLVLGILYASKWPQHIDDVFLLLVLVDRLICWVVVLLVAQQDVVEKRALTRKECTGNLKRFHMPVLLLQLLLFFDLRLHEATARLHDESHLC